MDKENIEKLLEDLNNAEDEKYDAILKEINNRIAIMSSKEKLEVFEKLIKASRRVTHGGLWKEDLPLLTKEKAEEGYRLVEAKLEVDGYHYQATFEKIKK